MTRVPIVFAFDNNLAMPAAVCLYSLLINAKPSTAYDIYILHRKDENLDLSYVNRVMAQFPQSTLTLREVGDEFDSSFEIRGVTTPTYYRLLISNLIPEHEKVLYADVDIIFRCDLTDAYNINMGDNYIAATYDLGMNLGEDGQKYIASMPELTQGEYLQAGFLLMNSAAIRKDDIVNKFKQLAKRKLKFQDQDILNIACDKKMVLPWKYNMTDYSYHFIFNHPELLTNKYANSDIDEAQTTGNLHFNGHKPWKKYSINFDIWWEYYRKSPVYDASYYFKHFEKKTNVLDTLTLWKRIKTVIRYFTAGTFKS